MKLNEEDKLKKSVKDFKTGYKKILEMEKSIVKSVKALKKAAKSLYVKGDESGVFEDKSMKKYFIHLDDIVFGDISFERGY